jgi:hypothetical protein
MGVGSGAFDVNIGSKHLASNSFSHGASTRVAGTDKQNLHSVTVSTTRDYCSDQ